MNVQDRIIGMWRTGMNTFAIARLVSRNSLTRVTEAEVHQIITAERNERKARPGFKAIEGGRNAANDGR